SAGPLVSEKEANNGFRQAQPIQVPQAVEGAIQAPQDVDVFKIAGKAGQKLLIEVHAARRGSPLDPILTLYDERSQVVARSDDDDPSGDARLEVTLPRDGAYFLSLIDAHDQGSPAHVYRIIVNGK
ncbi:MAG: PPC domain-containing protein, partial [Gemmataceae bacterium]